MGCKKGVSGLLRRSPHMVGSKESVALGLLNGLMPQKLPYGVEVRTIHNGMGSEGMAERMEGDVLESDSLTDTMEYIREPSQGPPRKPFPDWDKTLLQHGH